MYQVLKFAGYNADGQPTLQLVAGAGSLHDAMSAVAHLKLTHYVVTVVIGVVASLPDPNLPADLQGGKFLDFSAKPLAASDKTT